MEPVCAGQHGANECAAGFSVETFAARVSAGLPDFIGPKTVVRTAAVWRDIGAAKKEGLT